MAAIPESNFTTGPRRSPASHPLQNAVHKVLVEVEGKATDVILTRYTNRIFILATQNGKCGTLINAQRDSKAMGRTESEPTYSIKILLGKREDVFGELLARALIEKIGRTGKSLLLGLNIKDLDQKKTKELLGKILEHKVW
eukprot:CAMPEP_0114526792 /NCGR_PEP_ID=MMETSP0109-20121206/23235_1 /TAXON_ID=29199 /ORGANISM="Chlorarachnion reptans, Strain CCCM449" /LENGTH=140 /DNA_ID=CAMNT_0001708641 /DNA_START=62 /DNA_END=484 /DNA_ORIENTATION=+